MCCYVMASIETEITLMPLVEDLKCSAIALIQEVSTCMQIYEHEHDDMCPFISLLMIFRLIT